MKLDRVATKNEAPLPGRPVRGSSTGKPVMAALDLLGRRGSLRIVWELRDDAILTFRACRPPLTCRQAP